MIAGSGPATESELVLTSVIAITYIVTTLTRRDRGAVRLWALAYLFVVVGMVLAALGSVADGGVWTHVWATSLGSAVQVGAMGVFMLGLRAFIRRPTDGPSYLVIALALLTAGISLWTQQSVDARPGEVWTLLASGALALGASYHAVRAGSMGRTVAAIVATGFGLWAAHAIARAVMLVGAPDSVTSWIETGVDALALGGGALIAVSTFAAREAMRSSRGRISRPQAILQVAEFRAALTDVLRRAAPRLELIAVIAVRAEDFRAVRVSFGAQVGDRLQSALRDAVRAFASPLALVGLAEDPAVVYVATTGSSPADVRRQAGLVYRAVIRQFGSDGALVVPGAGVGVALSSVLGYSATSLIAAAERSAHQAGRSDETSVVVAAAQGAGGQPGLDDPS